MRNVRKVLWAACCLWSLGVHATTTSYRIGVLGSSTPATTVRGNNTRVLWQQAFDEANAWLAAQPGLEGGAARIEPVFTDISSAQGGALYACVRLAQFCNTTTQSIMEERVFGVLGPTTSTDAVISQKALAQYGIAQVSWSATSSELSSNELFPTFSRTAPSDSLQGSVLADLVHQIGWRRVAVVATSDVYGSALARIFGKRADQLGLKVLTALTFESKASVADQLQTLNLVKVSGARIILLFAQSGDTNTFMKIAANYTDLVQPPYVWIGADANVKSSSFPPGSLSIEPYVNKSNPLFVAALDSLLANPYANYTGVNFEQRSAFQYDAVLLFARAIEKFHWVMTNCSATPPVAPAGYSCSDVSTLKEQNELITVLLRGVTFEGISGTVTLDSYGDRIGRYLVYNKYPTGTNAEAWDNIWAISNEPGSAAALQAAFQFTDVPVYWPDGTALVPLDRAGVRVGEAVEFQLDGAVVVLSFGVAVVGAWTSLILTEQATVLPTMQTGLTRLHLAWLLLSCLALSAGIWASMLIGVTSVNLQDLPAGDIITFGSLTSFVAILAAVPCIYVAFLFLMRSLRRTIAMRPVQSSGTSEDSTGPRESIRTVNMYQQPDVVKTGKALEDERKRKAALKDLLDKENRFQRLLRDTVTPESLVAGMLVEVACIVVHTIIWGGRIVPCSSTYAAGDVVLGIVVSYVLVTFAASMYFHLRKSQLRFVGAFIMASGIACYHFVVINSVTFVYTGAIVEHEVTTLAMQLVGAVTMALFSFLFIGLNVTRLKLSRDLLDTYLLRAQRQIATLQTELTARDGMIGELSMTLNLIHLCRPLVRPSHFAVSALTAAVARKKQATSGQDHVILDSILGDESGAGSNNNNNNNNNNKDGTGSARIDIETDTDSGAPTETTTEEKTDELTGSPLAVAAAMAQAQIEHPLGMPPKTVVAHRLRDKGPQPRASTSTVRLPEILANSVTLEVFKDVVVASHNSENLAFCLDVQEYRRAAEPEDRRVIGAFIVQSYVEQNAPNQINLAGQQRDTILHAVRNNNFPKSLFAEAEKEVLALLERNDYARFCETDAFRVCCVVLSAAEHLKGLRNLQLQQAAAQASTTNRNNEESTTHTRTLTTLQTLTGGLKVDKERSSQHNKIPSVRSSR